MFISISQAAAIIGVCTKTLRRWHQQGALIPDNRTIGGHRRYALDRLDNFLNERNRKKRRPEEMGPLRCVNHLRRAAVYGRVSAGKQKEDLERQIAFLSEKANSLGFGEVCIYKDIASGLNDTRIGLRRLIKDGFARKYSTLFITHRDRLARFGRSIIYQAFELLNIGIWDRDSERDDSERGVCATDELVNDVLAILTSYSGKLYRLRRGTFSSA